MRFLPSSAGTCLSHQDNRGDFSQHRLLPWFSCSWCSVSSSSLRVLSTDYQCPIKSSQGPVRCLSRELPQHPPCKYFVTLSRSRSCSGVNSQTFGAKNFSKNWPIFSHIPCYSWLLPPQDTSLNGLLGNLCSASEHNSKHSVDCPET